MKPFAHLIGHARVKALLEHLAATDTFPSTLLFQGPKGVGKHLFALACAKLLMGPSHVAKLTSGHHPDFHLLRPEGKSALHTAESLRAALEEIEKPPFEAPVSVFVIEEAHAMQPVGGNTLLKTLEEPPSFAKIILLTDRSHEILPTLLSRCYQVPFLPIPQEEMISYLTTHQQCSLAEAELLSFRSGGSLGKVTELLSPTYLKKRSLLHQLLTTSHYAYFTQHAEALEGMCTPEEGEEHGGYSLLNEIVMWYRDLELLRISKTPLSPLYHPEMLEALLLRIELSTPSLEKILQRVEEGKMALSRHIKLKVILEEILLS